MPKHHQAKLHNIQNSFQMKIQTREKPEITAVCTAQESSGLGDPRTSGIPWGTHAQLRAGTREERVSRKLCTFKINSKTLKYPTFYEQTEGKNQTRLIWGKVQR